MTEEEFDAIRARVLTTYFNNGGFNGCFIDVTNLLAEVERLRKAAIWEEDQVLRMVTNAHLRGAQETREQMQAEVERLTAELHRMKSRPVEAEFSRLDTMWQQLVRERDEAVHELGRLKGVRSEVNTAKLNDAFTEGTLKAGEAMRPLVAAAFSRGVAAMRMAAARYLYSMALTDDAEAVRALPDPEDKP